MHIVFQGLRPVESSSQGPREFRKDRVVRREFILSRYFAIRVIVGLFFFGVLATPLRVVADDAHLDCVLRFSRVSQMYFDATVDDVARYVIQKGELPDAKKAKSLYARWLKLRGEPNFQKAIGQRLADTPFAATIYNRHMMTPETRTVADVIAYRLQFGRAPRSDDWSLHVRINKYYKSPEYVEEMAKQILSRDSDLRVASSARETAIETANFRSIHNRLPSANDSGIDLYRRMTELHEHPAYVNELAVHPDTSAQVRSTAQDLANWLIQKEKMPLQTETRGLWNRWDRDSADPAFKYELEKRLAEFPKALKVFKDSQRSSAERTGHEVKMFVSRRKVLPTAKTNSTLYKRMLGYENEEAFKKEVAKVPLAEKLLIARKKSTPQKIAEEVNAFVEATGQKLTAKTNPSLYARYFKVKNDPELAKHLGAAARDIVGKSENVGVLQALISNTVRYLETHGTVPVGHGETGLRRQFLDWKDERVFQQELRKHPTAWSIFVASELDFPVAQVDKLKSFLKTSKQAPDFGDDAILFDFYYRFKNDPRLLELLKTDREAWEIFKSTEKNLAEMTARRVVRFVQRTKLAVSESEDKLLMARYRRFRNDPNFVAIVSRSPEVRTILEKASLSTEERIVDDVTKFLLQNGDKPRQKTTPYEDALYQRLSRFRNDPKFISLLQENADAWAIYQYANLSAAGKTGRMVKEYIRQYGDVPKMDTNRELASKLRDYHSQEELLSELRGDEKIFTIYEKWREEARRARNNRQPIKPPTPDQIATSGEQSRVLGLVDDYIAQRRIRINQNIDEPADTFANLAASLSDPTYLAVLRADRYRWTVLRPKVLNIPELAASETIEYAKKFDTFPREEVDPDLYVAFRKFLFDPGFREAMKQDPAINARFVKWLEISN